MDLLSPEKLSERFPEGYSPHLFSLATRTIGYALTLPPEEVATQVSLLRPSYGPKTSSAYIATEVIYQMHRKEAKEPLVDFVKKFLSAAIDEVGEVTDIVRRVHENLDEEAIRSIMSHALTAQTIARLALRPEEDMEKYVDERLEHTIRITPDRLACSIDDEELTLGHYNRCPAAGTSHEVDPLPIFTRFIPWATELHLKLSR